MTYAQILMSADGPAAEIRKARPPRRLPRHATRGGRGGESRYAIAESQNTL